MILQSLDHFSYKQRQPSQSHQQKSNSLFLLQYYDNKIPINKLKTKILIQNKLDLNTLFDKKTKAWDSTDFTSKLTKLQAQNAMPQTSLQSLQCLLNKYQRKKVQWVEIQYILQNEEKDPAFIAKKQSKPQGGAIPNEEVVLRVERMVGGGLNWW